MQRTGEILKFSPHKAKNSLLTFDLRRAFILRKRHNSFVSSDIVHIIKLLDDPDPSVQVAIEGFLEQFDGNISEHIVGEAISLTKAQRTQLSGYLLPGRKKVLQDNWFVPNRFQLADSRDVDSLEYLLSLLSDFLHDGITLRPSLADSLDQLLDEVHTAGAGDSVSDLVKFLFKSGQFTGNRARYFSKDNSDLVWVLNHSTGNPISLVAILILIAHRLDLEVEGCNYPGHFLAWVPNGDKPYLLDPFNRGRILSPQQIMRDNSGISERAKKALSGPCALRSVVVRTLNNIETSMLKGHFTSDIELMKQLKGSLSSVSSA